MSGGAYRVVCEIMGGLCPYSFIDNFEALQEMQLLLLCEHVNARQVQKAKQNLASLKGSFEWSKVSYHPELNVLGYLDRYLDRSLDGDERVNYYSLLYCPSQ